MVLFVEAITAFIASHPERSAEKPLCRVQKSQIFGNRRDSAELLTSYSPDS